jgi:hypothetical protein
MHGMSLQAAMCCVSCLVLVLVGGGVLVFCDLWCGVGVACSILPQSVAHKQKLRRDHNSLDDHNAETIAVIGQQIHWWHNHHITRLK